MMEPVLIAFFAAACLIFLVWCLFGLLLSPAFGENMVTLCFCRGDGSVLEQRVRAYGWLREGRLKGGRLVLVDCGLDEEGLSAAQLLRRDHDWIDYCPQPALEDYLEFVAMT